jgi:hypothetical protein
VEALKLINPLFDFVEAVYYIHLVGAAKPCAAFATHNKMDRGLAWLKCNSLQSKVEVRAFWARYHADSPFALLSGGFS